MARAADARFRGTSANMPSSQELNAIFRNKEAAAGVTARRTNSGRSGSYAMTLEEAAQAASLMDRSNFSSPLTGLPVAPSAGEFKFAKEVFGNANDPGGLWDDYWAEDQSGYGYDNLAQQTALTKKQAEAFGVEWRGAGQTYLGGARTKGRGRQPADISVMPTSTINPDRPRTVAAGYDNDRGVLTTVFRDGTFYNYYDVPENIWDAFKAAQSKGRYIASVLDTFPRGTANMGKSTVQAREQLYRIARTGQVVNSPSRVRAHTYDKVGNKTGYTTESGVSTRMQVDRS